MGELATIGEIAALGAAFCFAIAATIYRNPLKVTDATSASILRFSSTGAILMSTVFILWGLTPFQSVSCDIILLTIASGIIALAFGDILYMTSFKKTGVARTVSLVATYPMFSLVLDLFIRNIVIPVLALLGTILILVGIWLLMSPESVPDNSVSRRAIVVGTVAGLSTAFLYALSMIFMDVALESVPVDAIDIAFALNALRTSSGGFLLFLGAPLLDRDRGFLKMSQRNVLLFIAGSLIAYGVGWFLLSMSFVLTSSAFVVPLSSTTPLFATVLAIFYLREPLSRRSLTGILTVVVGIVLIVVA